MPCGYALSGEVLGQRDNVAKMTVVTSQEHRALMVAWGISNVAARLWWVSRPPSK